MPPSLSITSWILALHQVLQEVHLLGPLEPDQEDGRLPLVHVGAIVTGQLLLHPGPHCLDWIEVR